MNVDTGQMGPLLDVLRDARPGERVIPATIIPAPAPKPAPKMYGARTPLRQVGAEIQAMRAAQEQRLATQRQIAQVFGVPADLLTGKESTE